MADGSRLVMSEGPQPGQTFMLDQDVLILGRDPHNDIVINNPQVSRQHARITRQGHTMVIEDVGSTNGTFVNGVRLTGPHTLTHGNVIGLGDVVTLTYHGADIATTEPLAGRPTVSLEQPSYEPPPTPPSPPPPPPPYTAAPPPPYTAAPPPSAQPVEEKKSRARLWMGCGCLVLLVIAACAGVFVLDYLRLLPPIFYEPLRWLGFI